jgi:hypothetical protein
MQHTRLLDYFLRVKNGDGVLHGTHLSDCIQQVEFNR